MATAKELREQRAKVWGEVVSARKLMTDDGLFTDESARVSYENGSKAYDELTARIAEAESYEAREAEQVAMEYETRQRTERNTSHTMQQESRADYDATFWKYMRRAKDVVLSPEEMKLLETRGTSTQITTTDSLGGYLVPQEFMNTVENRMKWYGGMLTACQVINSSMGGTLRWPTGDDTSTTGQVIAQNTPTSVADLTFGNVLIGSYTVDSKVIQVSYELLQDEDVSLVQGVVADNLANRLGRKINTMLTNGTGTSESYGLTTTVTNSGGTTAGATAITKKELINLVHSIDKAYRYGPNVGFMMNDTTLAYLRGLDVGNSDTVQIFSPSIIAGEPDRLLGFPVFINNDLTGTTNGAPVSATKHIYFGDFSKYVIRRVKDITMSRNDQLYWEYRKVGFMGYLRIDGNLINAQAIKYLLQA